MEQVEPTVEQVETTVEQVETTVEQVETTVEPEPWSQPWSANQPTVETNVEQVDRGSPIYDLVVAQR